VHRSLVELMHFCDTMDCAGITAVLSEAVSGFGGHEIRHDHVWIKQGRAGKRAPAKIAAAVSSNVKELFPERKKSD
jgi:hypothetical protein